MDNLATRLLGLVLRGVPVSEQATPIYLIVFGLGCGVMAEMVLLLDICVFVVRGWSFLRFRHHIVRTVVAMLLMPAAAGIVGMFGLALDVLQGSRAACIAVGVAWPSLMTVLFGVLDQTQNDDDDPEVGRELVG